MAYCLGIVGHRYVNRSNILLLVDSKSWRVELLSAAAAAAATCYLLLLPAAAAATCCCCSECASCFWQLVVMMIASGKAALQSLHVFTVTLCGSTCLPAGCCCCVGLCRDWCSVVFGGSIKGSAIDCSVFVFLDRKEVKHKHRAIDMINTMTDVS